MVELKDLKEGLFHTFGYSSIKYHLPVRVDMPKCYVNSGTDGIKVSHVGRDEYAMDFVVPQGEIVYAPASGKIVLLEQFHTVASHNPSDGDRVNQIIIRTKNRLEEYELKHIEANSCRLKIGDWVEEDQPLAVVGLNGYYVQDNGVEYPPHLHFSVHGNVLSFKHRREVPLRVRFKEFNIAYGINGSVDFLRK